MKRLLLVWLMVALTLTLWVNAGETAIIGSAQKADPGETVTITLDLSDNPGIASWNVTLDWDKDVLQLEAQDITLGEGFSGGFFLANADTAGQLRMAWANLENYSEDGVLVTLTFTVAESARADTYPITITAGGVSNQEGEPVSVATQAAEVVVRSDLRPVTRPEDEPEEQTEQETVPEEIPAPVEFSDLHHAAYYYQPALWAAQQGITSGTAPGVFSPEMPCDRGQAVTFLWRAYGSPEPVYSVNPFEDVSHEAYYYKAVLWAVEQGITTGTTPTTFAPGDTVTRAQIAAFLYRSIQANGGGFQGAWMFRIPFIDLPEWAFESIAWCYMKGITTGTSETTFSPHQPCTRGQIVTFLYRTFEQPKH